MYLIPEFRFGFTRIAPYSQAGSGRFETFAQLIRINDSQDGAFSAAKLERRMPWRFPGSRRGA
jgi:hypothetical protein